jgi:hypothetical protein
VSIERRGPSASLRFAQDDGVLGGFERRTTQARAKAAQRLSWLKGSSGFVGVDTFGVLRLRCAPLRMTEFLGELESCQFKGSSFRGRQ